MYTLFGINVLFLLFFAFYYEFLFLDLLTSSDYFTMVLLISKILLLFNNKQH